MQRKVIVLVPIKNESWILDLFLSATSIWADYIILADQHSTDDSRQIAQKHPKVILINNDSDDLDETYRDQLMVETARKIAGPNNILFRIDADEILTPSSFNSLEWQEMIDSESGSVWDFQWLNLCPDFIYYWDNPIHIFGAFVDDGRSLVKTGLIHSRELFRPINESYHHSFKSGALLHYQFTDWKRMQSKHRWYQCFEKINYPKKSCIDIYRMYHWMYGKKSNYRIIPQEWFSDYKKLGINAKVLVDTKSFWWDEKVEEYFKVFSPRYFNFIETRISGIAPINGDRKSLPATLLLNYLKITTKLYNSNGGGLLKLIIRRLDYSIKALFKI